MAFLARGLHLDWEHAFARFVTSYRRFPAGIPHRLYIIFKGYRDAEHLAQGQSYFARLPHVPIHTHDEGFDIGCYQRVVREMSEEMVCFLNTKSEILCAHWLRHLAHNLEQPGIGLVGNTGSYESPHYFIPAIQPWPNPHIRTNAFLIRREVFRRIVAGLDIRSKIDGWMFEAGPDGLSPQVLRAGLQLRVVDRAGRAWEPERWREANTYSTAEAAPLIGDDTYRKYINGDALVRHIQEAIVWGPASEEARVRAKYYAQPKPPPPPVPHDSLRPFKRLLHAVVGEKQFQLLKRSYRAVRQRSEVVS